MIWILLAAASIVSLGGYMGWRRSQSDDSLLLQAQRTISETKEVLKKFESLTDEDFAHAMVVKTAGQAIKPGPPAQRVLRELENNRNAYRVLLSKRDEVRAYDYGSHLFAFVVKNQPGSFLIGLGADHLVPATQLFGSKRHQRKELERPPRAYRKGSAATQKEASAW